MDEGKARFRYELAGAVKQMFPKTLEGVSLREIDRILREEID